MTRTRGPIGLATVLMVVLCLQSALGVGDTVGESAYTNVFEKGEAGYFCIKIPDLLVTNNGTLLAFGEARVGSCSDYTWTDLVMKRSFDLGKTWSDLQVVVTNSTASDQNVIGNAVPVALPNGQVLVPFCRNNLEVFTITSDDDGATWSTPHNITDQVAPPEGWGWVGLGPPLSIVTAEGRIVAPAYHDEISHYADGSLSRGHAIYSDDWGETWQRGETVPGLHWTSENQIVQLGNGTLLMNARVILPERIRSLSSDGGQTWQGGEVIEGLPAPLGGCEGSTINHPANADWLFFSGPFNRRPERFNMTLLLSQDAGLSWSVVENIFPGRSAYSALQVLPGASDLGLLFERSNQSLTEFIFVPDFISFTSIPIA